MLYRGFLLSSLLFIPVHSYAMIDFDQTEYDSFSLKRSTIDDKSLFPDSISTKKHKFEIEDNGSESEPSLSPSDAGILTFPDESLSTFPPLSLTDSDDFSRSSFTSIPFASSEQDSELDEFDLGEAFSVVQCGTPNPSVTYAPLSGLPKPSDSIFRSKEEPSKVSSPPIRSPLRSIQKCNSPRTPLTKFLSPFKREIASSGANTSPEYKKIFSRSRMLKFYNSQEFSGKTVFYQEALYDPRALVMDSNGKWETNLERMKQGRCPVGHRGIVLRENAENLTKDEIRRQQRDFRIELQHVTQKDTGTEDDPICEMTHMAHMSRDTNFVLKKEPETGRIQIIEKHLTVEEAKQYIEKHPDCYMRTNVLHFRDGPSLINRSEFGPWREKYWKHRANQIESVVVSLFN